MTVESLGEQVRCARRAQLLTQAQLAARAGVGRRFVLDIEAGHPRAELAKSLQVLSALGLGLDISASPVTVIDTKSGPVAFRAVSLPSGRPIFAPSRLWSLDAEHATASVTLPRGVYWSGGVSAFDLADQNDRELAYRILLTEGTPAVIVSFVDGDRLDRMWDTTLFPPAVRQAWWPAVSEWRHHTTAAAA
ncbi:MAG: helix-turn-helix transcriptional regulator [Bifidobacteriaceae bacterium]|jgi:y4mF family transcriptional regulator|nr:helix-turn-helix transcriptional regulator [Bifidobacteriaceae bacterium]